MDASGLTVERVELARKATIPTGDEQRKVGNLLTSQKPVKR